MPIAPISTINGHHIMCYIKKRGFSPSINRNILFVIICCLSIESNKIGFYSIKTRVWSCAEGWPLDTLLFGLLKVLYV